MAPSATTAAAPVACPTTAATATVTGSRQSKARRRRRQRQCPPRQTGSLRSAPRRRQRRQRCPARQPWARRRRAPRRQRRRQARPGLRRQGGGDPPADGGDADGSAMRHDDGQAGGAPHSDGNADCGAQRLGSGPAAICPPTAATSTASSSALAASTPTAGPTPAGTSRSAPELWQRRWRHAARPRRAGSDAPHGSGNADGRAQGLSARYANVPLGGHTSDRGRQRLGGRVAAGCARRPRRPRHRSVPGRPRR